MPITSKYRGHKMYWDKTTNMWHFSDSGQPVSENPNRECGHCGRSQTKDEHDGCIPNLPNVLNACCGHGNIEEAYVQFEDRSCIRGLLARNYQNRTRPVNI